MMENRKQKTENLKKLESASDLIFCPTPRFSRVANKQITAYLIGGVLKTSISAYKCLTAEVQTKLSYFVIPE